MSGPSSCMGQRAGVCFDDGEESERFEYDELNDQYSVGNEYKRTWVLREGGQKSGRIEFDELNNKLFKRDSEPPQVQRRSAPC